MNATSGSTKGGSADPEICAHWDWCPYCRNGLDTGLECDQCGADLMPVQKALEELQRLRLALEPEGWQPIETAPTDGRWFVGIYKSSKCPFVVRHDKDERMWCDTGDAYRNPTHWAALPETKEAKP